MPLKHLTETVLVVILAILTIATGIVVSTLPPIPEGFFPWTGVFVATVLYPAIVYPMLKNNRADYPFRALHFAPAAIAIVWLVLQAAVLKEPAMTFALTVFTWGYSAVAVAIALLLLAVFCLSVIRRRVPRLGFLIVLFVPFIAVAYASEQYTGWDTQLAALLWKAEPIEIAQVDGKNSSSLTSSKHEKNLASSSVPEEEAWRAKLRAVETGKTHSSVVSVRAEGPLKAVKAVSKLVSSKGTHLPKAGGEMESMGILFAAMCAGTVHLRARRRA